MKKALSIIGLTADSLETVTEQRTRSDLSRDDNHPLHCIFIKAKHIHTKVFPLVLIDYMSSQN